MTMGANEGTPLRPKDIGPDYGKAAQDLARQARDAAGSAADAAKQQGGELLGAAKDIAADARDRLMEQAQDQMKTQKKAGAEYLDGLAGTLDRVAGEIDHNVPFAGDFLRSAAQQVGAAADSVRNGDLSQLVGQVQDFARRQPTASFGLAMLAGFGLVRLLKSSGVSDAREAS
jgi:hypothetical protein